MPFSIFQKIERIQEKGILIRYCLADFSESDISLFNNQGTLYCYNNKDNEHIIVLKTDFSAFIFFVIFDDTNSFHYQLKQIQSKSISELDSLFNRCPCKELSDYKFIVKPYSEKISAENASFYTFDLAEEISKLQSCEEILEEERKRAAEKKQIEEQLEMWDLCIEAEQKMLVDTPFNCIGYPEVKKRYIDFNVSEYITSSDESVINEIEELLGGDTCEINESGLINITYDNLKRLNEISSNNNINIEEIISCEVDVSCDGHWNARGFKDNQSAKNRKIRYGRYNDDTSSIIISLLNIKSFDLIDNWIKDVNNSLEFYGDYEDEDVNCTVKITSQRIEEKKERKARIENLSRAEFYTDEHGIGTLGSLDSNSSDYGMLRIIFPQEKEEAKIVHDKIKELIEKKKTIKVIAPNLKKEEEILKRERKAVQKVRNEESLQNEKLKDFIFDSSKASPTEIFEHIDISKTEEFRQCQKLALLDLNESQEAAVVKSLYAKDLCLLQGPPGTGKTTVIAELIWQHIRLNQKSRIMLTSQTNLAIDNALSRLLGEFVKSRKSEMWRYMHLIKPLRIADSDAVDEEGLPFYPERIDNWVKEGEGEDSNNVVAHWMQNISKRVNTEAIQNCSEVLKEWKDCLDNPTIGLRRAFAEVYKENYNILGMTCGKVESADFRNNRGYDGFDVVIVDEASKATPPELLMPLCYAKKSVIIGDHRQLPPFIPDFKQKLESLETERAKELARALDPDFVETSLFKRLITNEKISETIKATFNEQYRMHNQINAVIEQFYIDDPGGLKCGLNPEKINEENFSEKESRYHGFSLPGFINPSIHTLWIDVSDGQEYKEGGSYYNEREVIAVENVIKCLTKAAGFREYFDYWNNCENIEQKNTEGEIGIISFYAKQVEKLRSISQSIRAKESIKSNVASVDRYQGRERGIVIVSTVRTNREGFTKSPERLNVALSRARRLLIVVGNSKFFSEIKDKNGNYIYRNVIEQIKENHGFINHSVLKNILSQN